MILPEVGKLPQVLNLSCILILLLLRTVTLFLTVLLLLPLSVSTSNENSVRIRGLCSISPNQWPSIGGVYSLRGG
ncbi:hypothetical protein EV426DRAFT_625522 [Tirmania nivea]|nr:hypothetical protein EV426DRAFT_625522 [Tirmania nivea]